MSRSIIVVGAGDALGGAIAKRFAREGFEAVIIRRNADQLEPLAEAIRAEGGKAHPFGVDARNEEQVVALFDAVEAKIAPIEAVVFNIGANVNFPIAETTSPTGGSHFPIAISKDRSTDGSTGTAGGASHQNPAATSSPKTHAFAARRIVKSRQ